MSHFRAVPSLVIASLLAIGPAHAQKTPQDQKAAHDLLTSMIGYHTAKGNGQVPAMVDLLVDRLKAGGFSDADIARVPVEIDGERTMGLVVRYKARAGSALRPVAFLAHMDVVDALAENWATDPFKPVEKDGYLYGRGSQDNKFGVALLVSTFIRLKQQGFEPKRDLILAFSGDEETGMFSTRAVIGHPFLANTEFAFNADAGGGAMDAQGKPIAFTLQAAEKTNATFLVSAANPGGHSSVPRADNAIYDLAHALVTLEGLRFPVEFNEITRAMAVRTAKAEGGEIGQALETLLKDPADPDAIAVMRRHPAISNILWTTCVATMLKAGNAPNALPQNAVATVNCRILPGTKAQAVQEAIRRTIGMESISVRLSGEAVESPVSSIRPAILAALTRAVSANYPGFAPEPSMSSGGTEGREYRRAGIATYGAGSLTMPQGESRAHGTDERLPLAPFYRELVYWDTLIRDIGKGQGQ